MGSRVSPVLANIFTKHIIKEQAITALSQPVGDLEEMHGQNALFSRFGIICLQLLPSTLSDELSVDQETVQW